MNKEQRTKIEGIVSQLEDLESEEREKYDNAPEGLQDSERVQKFEEAADCIQEAIDKLNEVLEA